MTNKDRLKSLLGFSLDDDNALEGELQDAGISGATTYDVSQSVPLKTMAIRLMTLLLTTPDTKPADGAIGIQIIYDREAVEKRIIWLQQELGLVDINGPTITAKHVW